MNTLKHYSYATFDDPVTRQQAINDPLFFLDTVGENAIIDEIQYVPQILSYIKMWVDRHRDKKGVFVFTGSQQFTMIKNLGDSLAGRIGLLELLPFSVSEKQHHMKLSTSLKAFTHAALTGSYPELIVDRTVDVYSWYGSYIQTYLERDIRSIYNIGSLRDFQRFLQFLAGRCSQILNMSQIANDLGISVPTVKSWLSILEVCRIVYLLPPYYRNLGKRITKSPKIYFTDIGIVTYLTGIKDKDHLMRGPMAGALFENFCIQETLKLYINTGQPPRIYYLRTGNNLEIDLLIEEPDQTLLPVEIKLSKTPSPGMGASIIRFKKLFPQLNVSNGIVLSLTEKNIPLSREITALTLGEYIQSLNRSLSR
jgi:predicted AAA+ superfamily ATPase